ncbi:unnamed protein product [Eruca vesicaria subsp. sativa]|uniref:FBD domain-containing protein n=1 Tax=Eruca vesicaria subsp. sativa TaxID=29727 RepID=A0ABC8L4J3_ERUVS|nr:unnamed protein product [Eruca vesicaria subsp. sativa]
MYLEMYTRESRWWDLLSRMLEHSPNLQILKLVGKYIPDSRVFGWEWNKPNYAPECLLSHLETFVWIRYDWKSENEEVAAYILKNARRLKSATISANPIKPKELNKLKERRKMFRKLDDVVRASSSCNLVKLLSLTTTVPKLMFVSPNNKFAENITKALLSHKAPILESLSLRLNKEACIGNIGIWLGIAFARHVRKLEIDLKFHLTSPSSMFCSPSLETLILKNSIHIDVPSPVSMKSLKTLHLQFVTYKDDQSVRNLLSGCPSLEDLLVHRSYIKSVNNFIIVAPSLKRLTIHDLTRERNDCGYVINAPSLKYLNIEMLVECEFCLIENSPELVEAKFRSVSKIVNETFLRSLKPAKRLSLHLSRLEIKRPTGIIFYQLVYLEVHTLHVTWWNLLTLLLDSSPKLQVLKIIDLLPQSQVFKYFIGLSVFSNEWSKPENVPECLLFQLKTFVWKRYDITSEEQKEVDTYILKNAIRLKKAAFSIDRAFAEFNELEERLQILKELVSNSCQFLSGFE